MHMPLPALLPGDAAALLLRMRLASLLGFVHIFPFCVCGQRLFEAVFWQRWRDRVATNAGLTLADA